MQLKRSQHSISGHYTSASIFNAVWMAFRLRADSDQILRAYCGDGIEPTILGPQALNIVMVTLSCSGAATGL